MLPAACMFMVQALTTTQLYDADVLMVVMVMRVTMVPAVVVVAVVVVTTMMVVVTRVVVMTMMVNTDLEGSDPQLVGNWCRCAKPETSYQPIADLNPVPEQLHLLPSKLAYL